VSIKNKGDAGGEYRKFQYPGESWKIEWNSGKVAVLESQPQGKKIDDSKDILVGDNRGWIVFDSQFFQDYNVTDG